MSLRAIAAPAPRCVSPRRSWVAFPGGVPGGRSRGAFLGAVPKQDLSRKPIASSANDAS
jgi:hypothetical protein